MNYHLQNKKHVDNEAELMIRGLNKYAAIVVFNQNQKSFNVLQTGKFVCRSNRILQEQSNSKIDNSKIDNIK